MTIVRRLSNMSLIDLDALGYAFIGAKYKLLRQKLREKNSYFIMKAKQFKSYPELAKLGELPLFNVYLKDGELKFTTWQLQKTESDELRVTLPDLNKSEYPNTNYDFVSYSYFKNDGTIAIKSIKDLSLKVKLAFDYKKYQHELSNLKDDNFDEIVVTEKTIDDLLEYLTVYNHYLLLKRLPLGKQFSVTNIHPKLYGEYNQRKVDLKSESGDIFNNVLCNTALSKYIATYNSKTMFTITEIRQVSHKKSNKSDNGKKQALEEALCNHVLIKCHNLPDLEVEF